MEVGMPPQKLRQLEDQGGMVVATLPCQPLLPLWPPLLPRLLTALPPQPLLSAREPFPPRPRG